MAVLDAEVIKDVLSGNTDSFKTLIDRYGGKVFKIVSAHIPNDEVDTVANDVFFKAFKSLSTYKGDAPFINWLSVVTVRVCNDYWRLNYARKDAPFSSFDEEFVSVLESYSKGDTPEDNVINAQMHDIVYDAMDELKPNERTVMNMLYAEERSISETAQMLNLSESNVKVIAFRSRKKLADILNKTIEAKHEKFIQ